MKNVILAVVVTILTISTTGLALQNQQLRRENGRLVRTVELTQVTNRGFETALTSCRLTLDDLVSRSQEHVVARIFSSYRTNYRPYQSYPRIAQARFDDGAFQTR